MNGKIPILLIKLNKSSLELQFGLVFFLLTVLSKKCADLENPGICWMLATSFGEQPILINGKAVCPSE